MRTVVLVLGDVGRSPRMQYHALSLADMKRAKVELVGYAGARPRPEIESDPRITIHHLFEFSLPVPRVFFVLWGPIKVILQTLQLLWLLLFWLPKFDNILVQNPPGLPALLVVRIASWILSARFIIDWHNMGYTLLALRFGGNEKHPFVRFAKAYERIAGRSGDDHICVTSAMKKFLGKEWGIHARVMHDCPPKHFQSLDSKKKHALFLDIERDEGGLKEVKSWLDGIRSDGSSTPNEKHDEEEDDAPESKSRFSPDEIEMEHLREASEKTSFTYRNESGEICLRRTRPALVVSSTSWTPDEDFDILLDAAVEIDRAIASKSSLPPVLIVITGRGPLLEEFKGKLEEKHLRYVLILTAWLKSEDYPKLLGAADIGISLHTSSSGLDLPMKVVDMFGCGLPVCAHGFACVRELVREEENGYIFNDAKSLSTRLIEVLNGFPLNTTTLRGMRNRIEKKRKGWTEAWRESVEPMFEQEKIARSRCLRGVEFLAIAILGIAVALMKYLVSRPLHD